MFHSSGEYITQKMRPLWQRDAIHTNIAHSRATSRSAANIVSTLFIEVWQTPFQA